MKTKESAKKKVATYIYFDPDVSRALKLNRAQTDVTVTDFVNDAVRQALRMPPRKIATSSSV